MDNINLTVAEDNKIKAYLKDAKAYYLAQWSNVKSTYGFHIQKVKKNGSEYHKKTVDVECTDDDIHCIYLDRYDTLNIVAEHSGNGYTPQIIYNISKIINDIKSITAE